MKIGIDCRLIHYRPGGSSEYMRQLVNELAVLDSDFDYRPIHHFRSRETLQPASNFRRVNAITPCHHRFERRALALELARLRLDLLHSPDTIPPHRCARRHVITIHDLHYMHFPQFMTADSLRYYRNQIEQAVNTADHILVSSQATRDDLLTLLQVPPEKITVHMLGVNEVFQPLPAATVAEKRTQLGLPETYFLFVGTFEPRKNISGLFRALHLLRQETPDVPPLVLAGHRGWLDDEIFATAQSLALDDRLIWLENPSWDYFPAIYNGACALILPSHYEGFGLTALEAMKCGTPPIVSDRSSLPEVVGDAGLLIDPDDPADIASAMKRILEDHALHERLRQAGLARSATFTWRRTAEAVLRVYQRLLSG
jgi:glycosyltransferase involved in cell wall biosynthesis